MMVATQFKVGSALRIRPFEADDVPAIIGLDEEVTGLAKPEYWQDLFERHGTRPRDQRFVLIAESDDRLEGFVIGEVRAWEFGSAPCGWIFAIQVRPRGRLNRVGTRLFEAICDRFQASGVGVVRTMLARDNTTVLSFFRSQGMMAGPFIELETSLDEAHA